MRHVIESIEGEYRRYKGLGEAALVQLTDDALCHLPSPESNSIATIVWHISGNLQSRFTDFLTTDGEKEWRDREGEFAERDVTMPEVAAEWDKGWAVLTDSLSGLTDADLERTITIRGNELTVAQALQRSLAHTSYHVGQIVFMAKILAGSGWDYLSIAPGGTAKYMLDPSLEKPPPA